MKTIGPPYSGKLNVRWDGKGVETTPTVTLLRHCKGGNSQRTDRNCLKRFNLSFTLDFIVTGTTREVLEDKVKPVIKAFLNERGLELSRTKTQITLIDEGFDFLGHHIRKYGGKLLIKPSQENVKTFLDDCRKIIKQFRGRKTIELIQYLNSKIRGWSNFYCHVVSKQIFVDIDDCLYRALAKWVKWRHPKKNATWWRKQYFRLQGNRHWIFTAKHPTRKSEWVDLLKMGATPIKRHVKIIAAATPYDEEWRDYFAKRDEKKCRRRFLLRQEKLLQSTTQAAGLAEASLKNA